ncbi:cyclic nucleotide-binding domain-containing protein [Hyalangium minutum]|uniref:PKA regulatory subunit-like protein n=1 Tax=Hyalangium minutum TaxID=394096 RepID=A0A085W8K4_9BACT|nr:cyclic nucleotide-binding domain-containing protein [Hyalangium minutum]KFE64017.1 PKA regulatory subunit-like protein [Hyalangium minutum]
MSRISSTDVVVPKSLSAEERQQLARALYAVHEQIFDGVEFEAFTQYVVESKAEHTWIQIHRNEAGDIVGYCGLHIFERTLGGVPTAVFRAEAGSLRAYRGGNVTMRFGMPLALSYLLRNPGRRAYYLGALVHPSSYTLLARYFGQVWPQREGAVPPELQSFIGELASGFGLKQVTPERPLVRQVGWKTRETEVEREYWQHCDKPAARFFTEANPSYGEGHGLMTLVPLTVSNMAHLVRTVCGRKLRQPVETVKALARKLPGAARLLRSHGMKQVRQSPLFAHFDTPTLEALVRRAEFLTLPAGQHVFRKGDASDELYLLVRGAAYVLAEDGGEEKVVDELGTGAVFGEMAMLAGERRSAAIRTATASTLVRIPRSVLLPLLAAHAHLRQGVWQTFAGRRFDDLVRDNTRFSPLGRKGRLAWLRQGQHRELALQESLSVEEGCSLFVLSGRVEFERAGMWVTTRSSVLMEAAHALRVVAREPTQLIVLPRKAAQAQRREDWRASASH